MTRTPKNPAASALAPAEPRSAAQATPGGPSPAVPPVAGEGGYASPHGQDRERAGLAGMPDPETGAADPATQTAAPVRGRAQAPAGSVTDTTVALPAGSTGLSGAEWRKQAKAATSALHAAQRRRAGRYTRIADRSAGSRYVPGGNRRLPPEAPGDGAA